MTGNRCQLDIDLSALRRNWSILQKMCTPGCTPIAVVKSNCYGLGAVRLAQELENAGCTFFSTADLAEALALRDAGLRSPILLLGPIDPADTAEALQNNIIVPAVDLAHAQEMSRYALAAGGRLRIHVKVDVGLSRLGIPVPGREAAASDEIAAIVSLPGLHTEGLMTHVSGMQDPAFDHINVQQLELFRSFGDYLKSRGISLPMHCESSLLYAKHPEYQMDYARITSAFLGIQPGFDAYGLESIFTLKSSLLQIKRVPKGTGIGYWRTYIAPRDMIVGIAGIGYGDGLVRSLCSGAKMTVRNRQVDVIGKLSMNYAALDLTDVPDAETGDSVLVFGNEAGAPSVFDYAALYGGHPCEVVSMLRESIPKVYLNECC